MLAKQNRGSKAKVLINNWGKRPNDDESPVKVIFIEHRNCNFGFLTVVLLRYFISKLHYDCFANDTLWFVLVT